MRYVYTAGTARQVMHILKAHPAYGYDYTPLDALCGIRKQFNRSINAPYALGRSVCKNCLARTG